MAPAAIRRLRRRLNDTALAFALNRRRLRRAAQRDVAPGPLVRGASPGEKLIALTYDDGPSQANTPILLDLFREHGARATFFVVGSAVEGNETLLRRLAEEGHEVANHTYSHANPLELDDAALGAEIDRAASVIGPVAAPLFRPPYGKRPESAVRVCVARGMTTVLWSVDSGDTRGFAADRIAHDVIRHARPGDIVLMHDGGDHRPATLAATRTIVEQLGAQGYSFVTVSELLAG